MKVYELMNELKDLPAGAKVKFSSLIGVSELTKFPHCEEDYFSYSKEIAEVESEEDSNTVILYG